MKLLFLGVFSFMAVGKDTFQANMLIEGNNGNRLLIDCGTDIRHSLYAQGYSHNSIDAVYISHLHSDHIGGLEWLGFSTFFQENRRVTLYISQDLITKLWQNALSAGMSSLEDKQAQLDTYFNVKKILDHRFIFDGNQLELIKTFHMLDNGQYVPSYGLYIHTETNKIFITTDSRFSPEHLSKIYRQANIIFQDCEIGNNSGQHARYEELRTLDSEIKQKMWLYGYSNIALPHAKEDGFLGFISQGQVFDI
ncbi:MBL fold metallo-hydrolase [Legionella hackeliae]|uniref:Uncharacterized protein n=1 Tax=Legionella hackeliae TaxID=449 RepID=A0A0A8UTG1_LEGHA|nr:MBL fold metallo-hydrolase [Legionella hackeliae]KTD14177.1 metal-dependent hydrolase of the beta-lactamase superfamily transporter III [Legionella hackeliae]CEK10387.1 conserved protein of unknown function [Legionella hackeliae]STX47122.1 metal-dependent hydrolase of the beta-lactamase superfamily transporter III [Legionella hackeliae]